MVRLKNLLSFMLNDIINELKYLVKIGLLWNIFIFVVTLFVCSLYDFLVYLIAKVSGKCGSNADIYA